MRIFPGCPALSGFRIDKILSSLRAVCTNITAVSAEFVHFALIDGDLDKTELERLECLLQYGTSPACNDHGDNYLLVIPRPGTISPWASKAIDIVHQCGLSKIERIERGSIWHITYAGDLLPGTDQSDQIKALIHDRMTQVVVDNLDAAAMLFTDHTAEPLKTIPIQEAGRKALVDANREMGLALSVEEMDYLFDAFTTLQRDPTDVELMMFAQANSEHCRHKIFNAGWCIDAATQDRSLFDMIRETYSANPGRVLSAYRDNAAVMQGYHASRFFPVGPGRKYGYQPEDVHILMKVETHNHPTAISPYPGAATGAGGEIRDEAATGAGAKPKAGLTGFTVSNLHIPALPQPWEEQNNKPGRIASALDIMLEGPIGAASYNNEFGRPALCGYFRTFEYSDPVTSVIRGYHKPIMLAGGYGMIREAHVHKGVIPATARIVVLGGPSMLIGLGGGAASSMASGKSEEELDFASVQRDNPEIQRRCQEVIDQCWALGEENPIISIHDVGAGGLANALPELVHNSGRGAVFQLRDIPSDDPGMSPMQIWCNEAQERYVLAIDADKTEQFTRICRRERAPFALIGEANGTTQLQVYDALFSNQPIDMPLPLLLGKPPGMLRNVTRSTDEHYLSSWSDIELQDAISRVMQLPAVADKRFLISIGDRSVSGLVARDQMVGPWQTAVADCTVTASAYDAYVGEAMALGERPPIAVVNAPASGRMAVTEAITNLCAARIIKLEDIALSANWMAACGEPGEDARLYDTVEAVTTLARTLKLSIPVGKDSLSMSTTWQEGGMEKQVVAPLSLNVTAFAPVADIRRSLTPQLQTDHGDTCLLLIDLGLGKNRLGGSALGQVFNRTDAMTPDLDVPAWLHAFFRGVQLLNEMGLILAYHDRSDGGLFVTLCEMAFAGRSGIDITLDSDEQNLMAALFSEEAGGVIQIRSEHEAAVMDTFINAGLEQGHLSCIGVLNSDMQVNIRNHDETIYAGDVLHLHRLWSATSFQLQSLRDNPVCARQEYDQLLDRDDPGLSITVSFDIDNDPCAPFINTGVQPPIAILREQGVNGHVEMAAAFDRAGFQSIDVHMNDLLDGVVSLSAFRGLVACGGFSYGDVLGAGGGWAKSVLFNPRLRDAFQAFFQRKETFGLGVCNGCQMMSQLRDLIPGAKHWPRFIRNLSEQFESRLVMVEVTDSPSILLTGMNGSRLPIVVAHGEGRIEFSHGNDAARSKPCLHYIDNYGNPTERYPANPNGSPGGVTGFSNDDGRFTIMMPHPERVFLRKQYSWIVDNWRHENSPWMRLFQNARRWVG